MGRPLEFVVFGLVVHGRLRPVLDEVGWRVDVKARIGGEYRRREDDDIDRLDEIVRTRVVDAQADPQHTYRHNACPSVRRQVAFRYHPRYDRAPPGETDGPAET
ncbi:MAG TPA: hypothetical protein VFB19_07910 [Mycobacterium sp.]|nr:hypothetical protein [Mycobacterium sp.]